MKKLFALTFTLILLTFLVTDAQEISLVSQIYDFEIGDEFHVREKYGPVLEKRSIIKIIEKQFSENGDTLTYHRQINRIELDFWNDTATYFNYIDTVSYCNLVAAINEGYIDTVFYNPTLYNQRLINRYDKATNPVYETYYDDYIVGCGGPYEYFYDAASVISWFQCLEYFKKGNEEWGTQLIVGTQEFENNKYEIDVFPNPAGDFLCISTNGNQLQAVVRIYNLSAQVLLEKEINTEYDLLNISNLFTGMYLIVLQSEDYIWKKKFLKK
jgi:hypothetical protein